MYMVCRPNEGLQGRVVAKELLESSNYYTPRPYNLDFKTFERYALKA